MARFDIDEMAKSICEAAIRYMEEEFGASLADVRDALALMEKREKGLVVELPGDGAELYDPRFRDDGIMVTKFSGVIWNRGVLEVWAHKADGNATHVCNWDDLGETVFLTRADAEERLTHGDT